MGEEKNFENQIKKLLADYGWYVKYWGGGYYTTRGIPDILACVNGVFVGVEVKSNTGKVSPLQVATLKSISSHGGYCVVARPKDYQGVEQLIKALHKGDHNKAKQITQTLKEW